MRKVVAVAALVLLLVGLLVLTPAVSATGSRPKIIAGRGTRTPSMVSNINEAPRQGSAAYIARTYLGAHTSTYGIADTLKDLRVQRVNDSNGRTLVRFAQVIDGVPVFGAEYVVTLLGSDDGYSVRTANGHFFSELSLSTGPGYSVRAARALALTRARSLMKVSKITSRGLTILPEGGGRLAYHLTLFGKRLHGGLVSFEMFLDARNGDVAFMYDNLQHDADGSVNSKDSHGVPVPTNYVETSNRQKMRDRQRDMFTSDSGIISTHDAEGGGDYTATNANIVTRDCCGPYKNRSATDAHWGAGETYEFYKNLGRNSIDDQGMSIKSTVHYSEGLGDPYCNAFWDGEQMVYGDCLFDAGETFPLSADLDVVGHELTHGVTQFTANLVYANESGAMNEAYSDYFGNAIDDNVNDADLDSVTSGYIGEDICQEGTPPPEINTPLGWVCPLRDLNDGRTIDDYVFYLIDYDNGGVHLNSTIYGGALWDFRQALYTADGQLGSDRADQYVLDALETMTPLDSFVDGRNTLIATIDAAGLATEAADLTAANAAFDGKGIVAGWDTGAPNDATVLVQNVGPTGFFFSPPAVSDGRFVIGDYADKTETFGFAKQIYVGNTAAPVDLTKVSTDSTDTYSNELPDISGDQVVWVRASPGRNNFDFNVWGRDLDGGPERVLAGGNGSQSNPSIDGDLLAWQKGFSDIYARKLGNKPRRITGKGQQMNPQVAGKWIVYQEFYLDGGTGVGMYNWKTRKTTVIKSHGPGYFGPPGVGGGYVYWFKDAKFVDNIGGIVRAKLGDTTLEEVVPQSEHIDQGFLSGNLVPSANKNYVVYFDERRAPGSLGAEGIDADQIGRDVYIVEVTGGTPELITDNRGEQSFPAIIPGTAPNAMWIDTSRASSDLMINIP